VGFWGVAKKRSSRHGSSARSDPLRFIREHTRLAPVPSVPEIRIHVAHEATGLWRIAEGSDPPPPYWAFPWAGGLALARHILAHRAIVRGRAVMDLGSGSGLVAIAAMKAGARAATASDVDPFAVAATTANAEANGVVVDVIARDITGDAPPAVDIVLVGDLFYEAPLAMRVAAYLDRCSAAGIDVLVGDPRRTYLPVERLKLIGEYDVPDVGDVEGARHKPGAVFRWR
jgi:predicted nicotinamide N-methyase